MTLSDEEHRMLGELARDEDRSAASWIRVQIRQAYEARRQVTKKSKR